MVEKVSIKNLLDPQIGTKNVKLKKILTRDSKNVLARDSKHWFLLRVFLCNPRRLK